MTPRMLAVLAGLSLLVQPAPALARPPGETSLGYQPHDADERGLWMLMNEEERKTRDSNFVIRDEALNAYVREVFCRTVGPECADVRIYLMRTPYFNASMAPNGMMQVWSGLLLRTRDEAELAAVLAHEFTHFKEQHSLRIFRDIRNKSTILSFLSVPLSIVGGVGATSLAQLAMLATIFGFSRDQERAADVGSVRLLGRSGYDPAAASEIWADILAEREATAAHRRRAPRVEDAVFGTHPLTEDRMDDLRVLAAQQPAAGTDRGRDRYHAALAPWWATLVDDQIKLNDYGATELLLERLAADGWTPQLLYARAELMRARGRADDLGHAVAYYRAALADPAAPVEAHRGLGLALLRKGERPEGRAALRTYLAARPECDDRAMLQMLSEG